MFLDAALIAWNDLYGQGRTLANEVLASLASTESSAPASLGILSHRPNLHQGMIARCISLVTGRTLSEWFEVLESESGPQFLRLEARALLARRSLPGLARATLTLSCLSTRCDDGSI